MSRDSLPKEKMVYFRTSLGGFNREDVNEYIASLSENFAKEKAEYEKKLDDLIEL